MPGWTADPWGYSSPFPAHLEANPCPSFREVLGIGAAPMGLGDAADQGQAQVERPGVVAGGPGRPVGAALESVERVGLFTGGEAFPLVVHLEHHRAVPGA